MKELAMKTFLSVSMRFMLSNGLLQSSKFEHNPHINFIT